MWLNELRATSPHSQVVLVGNKIDKSGRQILSEEGNEFAKENKIPYIETSTLTGENVTVAFELCAEVFIGGLENGDVELTQFYGGVVDSSCKTVRSMSMYNKKKSSCCM